MSIQSEPHPFSRNNHAPIFVGAGFGAVRVALLFGSGAVALALLATPYLDGSRSTRIAQTLDHTATGSIARDSTYTVRRSVLQASPSAVCVIDRNGTRRGEC